MKRKTIFLYLAMVSLLVQGQPTAKYYQGADGKRQYALKTALSDIIKPHTNVGYAGLLEAYKTTDRRADGKVWDMYSDMTNFTFDVDKAGSYKKEGDVYNREHSVPASWFNNASPMYSDLFHVYPTDGYVNNRRGNYPFGENKGEKYKSHNSFCKLGACTVSGYTGICFEPNDEYKGDFARSYFYMATCYEDKISSWDSDMFSGDNTTCFKSWALQMLLRWSREDPVSQKEIDRNNAVETYQHNRNPFIDFPGIEQYIWGTHTSRTFSSTGYVSPWATGIDEIPATQETVRSLVIVYDLGGRKVQTGGTDGLKPGIYIVNGKRIYVN